MRKGSEWLVPEYAHYHGSNSCSAILNKHLKDLDFRSHMFRHALIDRMKAFSFLYLAVKITAKVAVPNTTTNFSCFLDKSILLYVFESFCIV